MWGEAGFAIPDQDFNAHSHSLAVAMPKDRFLHGILDLSSIALRQTEAERYRHAKHRLRAGRSAWNPSRKQKVRGQNEQSPEQLRQPFAFGRGLVLSPARKIPRTFARLSNGA
jgi:hypothetical protein